MQTLHKKKMTAEEGLFGKRTWEGGGGTREDNRR
jgi:hypothetical protein